MIGVGIGIGTYAWSLLGVHLAGNVSQSSVQDDIIGVVDGLVCSCAGGGFGCWGVGGGRGGWAGVLAATEELLEFVHSFSLLLVLSLVLVVLMDR